MTNSAVGELADKPPVRVAAEDALLDAAERLLVDVGHAGITTRRLAEEAGVNHGLVHYYFGSNENLLVRALERFTERLIARQRELYAADLPFVEKWRTAMRYLVSEDVAYEKIWLELQALGWNNPDLRARLARGERGVAGRADRGVRGAASRAGIDLPLEALVSLVMTFNLGIIVERLGGIDAGHARAPRLDRPVAVELTAPAREQTRARYPDESGYVERDGVRLHYEVYGSGEPTVLLLPTWSIIHSRHWKMQIPYLARHCRVLTFDGRGNGRSDRPDERLRRARVRRRRARGDGRDRRPSAPSLVSLSLGAQRALLLAAEQPERVDGAVFICPAVPLGRPLAGRGSCSRGTRSSTRDEGWAKYNRHYWLRDYRGFLEFFFSQMFNEPHSTKPIEDCVGWGLETTPETLVATQLAREPRRAGRARAVRPRPLPGARDPGHARTRSPGKHAGSRSPRRPAASSSCSRAPGTARTCAIRSRSTCCCATSSRPRRRPARWVRGRSRRKRALYISSPIGLGHAQRDAAIADELRKLHPDLEIDWLAQHPVTEVLEARGERVHPASAHARQRVGPHRERVGRARPALLPGDPPDGRDPARQLHGLPRPRPRGGLRPLDRRRGVGARLLPAREPRAEARRLRLAHRLRRLAADGPTAASTRRS